MSYDYSENNLIQKSSCDVLKNKLGWDVVYAYNAETFGNNGTLGRNSEDDIVLTRYLKEALFRNNDWLDDGYCDMAVRTLLSYVSSSTLMQINEEKYKMLLDGIPVQFKKPDGTYETRYAAVFDFDEPESNSFIAVREMKFHISPYNKQSNFS